MKRREFLIAGAGSTTILAGCTSSDVVLKGSTRSTTGRTWDEQLRAGDELEFSVRLDDGMAAEGHVKRLDDDEVMASRTVTTEGRWRNEEFEVPTTTDYEIMVEPSGPGEASARLRNVE